MQGFHLLQAGVQFPTDFPGAKLIHLPVDPVIEIEEASEVIVTKIVFAGGGSCVFVRSMRRSKMRHSKGFIAHLDA